MLIYSGFSAPGQPASFATWENKWLVACNGVSRPAFWDPVTYPTGAVMAGITAPATADSIVAMGSGGPITGTYTAYYRFYDAMGNVSDLSPVSSSVTASGAQSIVHTIAPSPAAEAKVSGIQVFRNTDGQVTTYYQVATLPASGGTVDDTYSDTQLQSLTALPILNADGTPNANINGVPPSKAIAVQCYQDRSFWLLGDDAGTLMYSAAELPQSVLATNTFVLASADGDSDAPTGLMTLHGFLYLMRERHVYQLSYATDPGVNMNVGPVVNRGCLNQQCWVVAQGMAYLMDAQGVYAFGGFYPEDIGAPIQDYFRNGTIDLSKSKWFFASYEPQTRVVRFHVSFSGETRPKHALCYSTATKAWWLESFLEEIGGAIPITLSGSQKLLFGGQTQIWKFNQGLTDNSQAVAWSYATPLYQYAMIDEGYDREARVIFNPTVGQSTMSMQLYDNHNSSADAIYGPAIVGDGITVPASGGTVVTVNMCATRSSQGTAPGFERIGFPGQFNDRAQTTRWLKLRLSGNQSTDAITLYGIEIIGAVGNQ